MVTSLVESLLSINGNVRSTSIIGASRPDQSRIFTPGTNKDISSRAVVGSTVRNDVGKANKLNATVEGSSTDKWNMASLRIEESTPKKYLPQSNQTAWLKQSDEPHKLPERSDSIPHIFQAPDHSYIQCMWPKKRRRRYQDSKQRWDMGAHAQRYWNGGDSWRD